MPDQLNNLKPDEKLLFYLCRLFWNEEEKKEALELIKEVKGWKYYVNLINQQGITALAANNIKEAGFEKEIPADAWVFLENGGRQTMARTAWISERWKEVNIILGDAGIKHILLKGMALEHTLYGAKGLRQMSDTDILLRRGDAMRAWKLLQKMGYAHHMVKSPLHNKILLETGKHLPALYKNSYSVEIHHKLFDTLPQGIKADHDFFADAEEITVADTKALILSKEMHLKYLIAHFEKHALEGNCQLRQYADILLIDKDTSLVFPRKFLREPFQEYKRENLKAAFRADFYSTDPKIRLRYLTGDIFPSLEWMMKRHNCTPLKAVLRYPERLGKLLWLI
jgi:hypothetical protein